MIRLTDREQEVLDFIIAYRSNHGISPTLREIATGVCLKSPSSIQRYVTSLINKGCLQNVQDKMRTLVPVGIDTLPPAAGMM